MNEYIEKAELIKKLCFETAEWCYSPTIKTIKDFPSSDVQSVKRGRWICEFYNNVFDVYQADCSVCKRESTDKYDKVSESYEYCPHCGAKMIEGGNENDTL